MLTHTVRLQRLNGNGSAHPTKPENSRSSHRRRWITRSVVRVKNPESDLKLKYNRVFAASTLVNLVLHVLIVLTFPDLSTGPVRARTVQTVIQMEDIPETRQIERPPPPPRPSVPIATESEDVPDDVTIESTDLDFDSLVLDFPPPPPPGTGKGNELEEEVLEFWAVEEAPVALKEVAPEYPEIARRSGMEGTVFMQFIVGSDGLVKSVKVLKGPEIFRESAIKAVLGFQFRPAYQNDKPVSVWVTLPIRFKLAQAL